ncbi:PaaI family thioesterase [Actinoplanes sp. GCM10030250]|uniref:PaaI family thioesterase n=1 Tax=Actinoplanes sp. GCM10030250 TaxID=3273376 RepID=UPI0036119E17
MDATGLARSLLGSIPAHQSLGLDVVWSADGVGEVAVQVPLRFGNVIGALHSSGLITLIDAAGLAAIVSACPGEGSFDGLVPLGTAAALRFLAPARGRLLATCELTEDARRLLTAVCGGEEQRVRFRTSACVTSEAGTVVCEGTFDWNVRRVALHRAAA